MKKSILFLGSAVGSIYCAKLWGLSKEKPVPLHAQHIRRANLNFFELCKISYEKNQDSWGLLNRVLFQHSPFIVHCHNAVAIQELNVARQSDCEDGKEAVGNDTQKKRVGFKVGSCIDHCRSEIGFQRG